MKRVWQLMYLGVLALAVTVPCYAANSLVLAGSTTVLPIAQRAAEDFMNKNPSIDISVRGGGSGVGIAALIDGTCDIADSSRPIKDTELDTAVSRGRNPKAHVIAMDGIAVIVHPSNPIGALTKKQVKDIFTGKISNWSQLGGANEKIVVLSRDTSSGTYEAFGELALKGEKPRSDALLQASNQAIASTVAKTAGAVGYVGLAFLSSSVKTVPIDGIIPSKETVLSGKFPYSRPLFMYTNGAPTGALKDFMDFVLSAEGQKIADDEGYVGLK
jgi:phosphate transport system substrate-binding protein